MSRTIEHFSTNQRIRCRVLDLNGEPYEGLAYNATGIAVSFQRIGSTATSISLVLGTGLNDDHSDGKWNEIGDGWYQLDAPDGAFSGGVDSPLFYGTATGYTFIFEPISLVTSLTAAGIVNEWETQSQADPTGFHVNVKEVNGSSVTGVNDFKATGFSTHSAADVWAAGTRTLTAFAFDVDLNADQSGVTIGVVTDLTNGVTLQDDAITSAKFDESTAYPLTSADSGSTQVARTGADGDTLKSLSDQLDGVTTLVGSANVTITSPVPNATTIELIEGDRYDGTRSPKLSWTVAKDYSGTTITLNIWRVNDDDTTTSMFTGSGAVDSSTEVSVTMTATFLSDVDYEGCPAFEKLQFALTATASGDDETIARGNCYVYQRIEG